MPSLKHCLNPKVIVAVVTAGFAVYVFAPAAVTAVLPVLALAICPLSMIAMMLLMRRGSNGAAETHEAEFHGAGGPDALAEANPR